MSDLVSVLLSGCHVVGPPPADILFKLLSMFTVLLVSILCFAFWYLQYSLCVCVREREREGGGGCNVFNTTKSHRYAVHHYQLPSDTTANPPTAKSHDLRTTSEVKGQQYEHCV